MIKLLLSIAIFISSFSFAQEKNLQKFLDDIGYKESRGNYQNVSKRGYLGKYQFHRNTLNFLGVKERTDIYLKSHQLQDETMVKYMKYHKKFLSKEIETYVGKVINGVLITESGILASAHLGGGGNVKKFFKYGKDFKDGNGVSLTNYMKLFGGYELNLD